MSLGVFRRQSCSPTLLAGVEEKASDRNRYATAREVRARSIPRFHFHLNFLFADLFALFPDSPRAFNLLRQKQEKTYHQHINIRVQSQLFQLNFFILQCQKGGPATEGLLPCAEVPVPHGRLYTSV